MVRRLNERFDIPKVDVNGFSYKDAKKNADASTRRDGYSNAVLLWPDGSFTITRVDHDGNPVGWEPKGTRILYISKSDWSGGVHKAIGTEISDGVVIESSRPKTNKNSVREVYVSDSDARYIEVWDVNENEISNEVCDAIGEAVGYIDSGDGYPTWKWEIGSGDGGTYYLVLGFAPGFDPNEDEYTDSYGSHLALKWGILSNNSAMAEYDMDFEMPYDPETGDVWDSEQAIYSNSPNIVASDVKDVLNNFYEYAKQVNGSVDADFDYETESKKRPLKKSMKESLEPDAGYIEIYNVNKNKIAKEVEEAANEALAYVGSDEARPTWHWNIGEDEDNYYAIVLGFTSEDDVAMKWAYISNNSAMNEYDMDYLMPYDSDTGDVWDSEQIVDGGYDMTADVEYLLNNFKEYAEQRNSEWDEFEDDLYGDFDDADFDEDDLEYESIRLKRESTNKRRPTIKRKQDK